MWLFPYTRFSLFKLQFQVHTLKAIKRIAKHSGSHVRNPRSSQVRLRPYSNTATTTSNLNASPEGKILVSNLAYKVTEADLWVTII